MELSNFLKIWLPIIPLILLNLYVLVDIGLYAFKHRKKYDQSVKKIPKEHSFFIHHLARRWWYEKSTPIENYFIRKKIHPNILTYISLIFGFIGGILFCFGLFGLGGWCILLSGACDSLDGRLARESKTISSSGAFLDSTLDRLNETFIFIGLLIFFRSHILFFPALFSFAGSYLISYTRARGQGLGIDFDKGLMQRPERVVYLAGGAVIDPIIQEILKFSGYEPHPYFLGFILFLIATLSCATAIYRISAIAKELSKKN